MLLLPFFAAPSEYPDHCNRILPYKFYGAFDAHCKNHIEFFLIVGQRQRAVPRGSGVRGQSEIKAGFFDWAYTGDEAALRRDQPHIPVVVNLDPDIFHFMAVVLVFRVHGTPPQPLGVGIPPGGGQD